MTTSTLDLTCSCGARIVYTGPMVNSQRYAFLEAHEVCRQAWASPASYIFPSATTGSDVQKFTRSLLKLQRRSGRRAVS